MHYLEAMTNAVGAKMAKNVGYFDMILEGDAAIVFYAKKAHSNFRLASVCYCITLIWSVCLLGFSFSLGFR